MQKGDVYYKNPPVFTAVLAPSDSIFAPLRGGTGRFIRLGAPRCGARARSRAARRRVRCAGYCASVKSAAAAGRLQVRAPALQPEGLLTRKRETPDQKRVKSAHVDAAAPLPRLFRAKRRYNPKYLATNSLSFSITRVFFSLRVSPSLLLPNRETEGRIRSISVPPVSTSPFSI